MHVLNPNYPRHAPGAPRRRMWAARRRWERHTFSLPPRAQAAVGAAADAVAPAGTPAWYLAAAAAVGMAT